MIDISWWTRPPRARRISGMLCILVITSLFGATPSLGSVTGAPHWLVDLASVPTVMQRGEAGTHYVITVVNDGSQATDGSPITITDDLPAGITASEASGKDRDANEPLACTITGDGSTQCHDPGASTVAEGDALVLKVSVSVSSGAQANSENVVTVKGGGAPDSDAEIASPIGSSPAGFGVSYYHTEATDQNGEPDTQAGSHPFQLITSLGFTSDALSKNDEPLQDAYPKDIDFSLPTGLLGNGDAVPRCSATTFQTIERVRNCPPDTQVGTMRLFFYGSANTEQEAPVYDIDPPPGEPGELGVSITSSLHLPIFLKIRDESDYGLSAELQDISEAAPVSALIMTLWGVPADPRHDDRRLGLTSSGAECDGCASGASVEPFLTLPATCPGTALGVNLGVDSWQAPATREADGTLDARDPHTIEPPPADLPPLAGCERLSFQPSAEVSPETLKAGYDVDLRIPQDQDPEGLATPAMKSAAISLSSGTSLSLSVVNNLDTCVPGATMCPPGAQIGTTRIDTPLLPHPLQGQIYLGQPGCAPCTAADAEAGKLLHLLVRAEGSGLTIKLEGSVSIDQITGQMTTHFQQSPQLPFEDLVLEFEKGPLAPFSNPTTCGEATATADLTPWSTPFTPDALVSSSFQVTGCVTPEPFAPGFTAGTLSNQAGSPGAFSLTFARASGEQSLESFSVTTPPGLVGMLGRVPTCEEPAATRGTCPGSSLIGHALLAAGTASNPLELKGEVFLTGPYGGGPYGLSIVVPAQAGPFNLGTIVIRGAISLDPRTLELTISSGSLPQTVDGIPLQLRSANVTIDRPGFMTNPTDCDPLTLTGTAVSTSGASTVTHVPFQAVNCATLPFKPTVKVSTHAHSSRANGDDLDLRITYPRSAATNTRAVALILPKLIAPRLTTIQHACRNAVFAGNPAACPASSRLGGATVATPTLAQPLAGAVYLVSLGGKALPELALVLQSGGVHAQLIGSVSVTKAGNTQTTFASMPDVPISSLQMNLPVGPHSAFTATGNLCQKALTLPTKLTAQNGAVLQRSTKLTVTGCPKPKRKAT